MSASGLSIGSLFSGIGGLDLGLERAGLGPVQYQIEADPFCRDVLAKHWPTVRRYPDVRRIRGADLPPVAVLAGGFPCQDLSQANPGGAGLDGDRSGLWHEFARLVEEIRPRAVVVENVRGLLGGPLDVVAGRLTEFGYTVEATRILAADIGAPHLRERVFLVAVADPNGHALRKQPGRGEPRPETAESGRSGETGAVADPDGRRRQGSLLPRAPHSTEPQRSGESVADGVGHGRQERVEPGTASGAARGSGEVADPNEQRSGRRPSEARRETGRPTPRGVGLADADRRGCEVERQPEHGGIGSACWDQPDGRDAGRWRGGGERFVRCLR